MRIMTASTAAMIALLTLAAAPATQPVDKNTTVCDAPDVKGHFRVPKTWQSKEIPGTKPGVLFVFDPAPKKKPSSATFLQQVQISLEKSTAGQDGLDGVVAHLREVIVKQTPGTKFTKDAALTYVGQPAWTLQWTRKTKVAYATTDGKTGASYIDTDCVTMVWLQHGAVCQVTLQADTRFMPTLMQKGEAVAKTITFDD